MTRLAERTELRIKVYWLVLRYLELERRMLVTCMSKGGLLTV